MEIEILGEPDELSLVDADIKAVFEGTNYFIGTPTTAQLAKNMKILSAAIAQLVEQLPCKE